MNDAAVHSLIGGMLIGAGVATLLLLDGKIAGISGILSNVLHGLTGENHWRMAFLLGLAAPAAVIGVGPIQYAGGAVWLAASGVLVGVGTRLGSGCTSGHGVCGIANLSLRSAVATVTFMAAAAITVFLLRHGPAR